MQSKEQAFFLYAKRSPSNPHDSIYNRGISTSKRKATSYDRNASTVELETWTLEDATLRSERDALTFEPGTSSLPCNALRTEVQTPRLEKQA